MKRKISVENDGFTLIEVILSIAILSIVSIIVLRLFVTSHNLNDQSRYTDLANNTSTNLIESVKSYRNLNDFLNDYSWITGNRKHLSASRSYDESFNLDGSPAFTLNFNMNLDDSIDNYYNLVVDVTTLEGESVVHYETGHYFIEGMVSP